MIITLSAEYIRFWTNWTQKSVLCTYSF